MTGLKVPTTKAYKRCDAVQVEIVEHPCNQEAGHPFGHDNGMAIWYEPSLHRPSAPSLEPTAQKKSK